MTPSLKASEFSLNLDKIVGKIHGSEHWIKDDIIDEAGILTDLRICEKELTSKMKDMANKKPNDPFDLKLEVLGFIKK